GKNLHRVGFDVRILADDDVGGPADVAGARGVGGGDYPAAVRAAVDVAVEGRPRRELEVAARQDLHAGGVEVAAALVGPHVGGCGVGEAAAGARAAEVDEAAAGVVGVGHRAGAGGGRDRHLAARLHELGRHVRRDVGGHAR